MKVLLDTNVIMDALQERQPFDAAAREILLLGQNGSIAIQFTANSIADIFYLYSKVRGNKQAKDALSFLLNTYDVSTVTKEDCIRALALPNDDFEDALIEICAEKAGVDYIVSRDEEFIKSATAVGIITPAQLLSLLD